MLNDLTIIIPTRNRYKSVNIQVDYIKGWGSQIFLLDGSDEKNSYLDDLSKKLTNINYIHNTNGLFSRFENIEQQINTKYSMIMADDEFFIKKTIEMCIEYLENNADYVSCSGVAIGFMESYENKVIYREIYPRLVGYKITANQASDRVIDHMSKYVPCAVYAVLQSKVLKKFIKEMKYSKTSCTGTIESWQQCTTAYMGKIMVLPVLYWFRNLRNSPVKDKNWNPSLKFYKWYNTDKYKAEKQAYIKNFCKLNNENSTSFFEIALSNFSKDLRQRKGQGTFKLARRLFIKRSTNFILRKLKLKKLLAKKNESNFFDYEALKIFLKENKILYEIESIKKIEEIFLQK